MHYIEDVPIWDGNYDTSIQNFHHSHVNINAMTSYTFGKTGDHFNKCYMNCLRNKYNVSKTRKNSFFEHDELSLCRMKCHEKVMFFFKAMEIKSKRFVKIFNSSITIRLSRKSTKGFLLITFSNLKEYEKQSLLKLNDYQKLSNDITSLLLH